MFWGYWQKCLGSTLKMLAPSAESLGTIAAIRVFPCAQECSCPSSSSAQHRDIQPHAAFTAMEMFSFNQSVFSDSLFPATFCQDSLMTKLFREMTHESMDVIRKGLPMDAHPKNKRVFTKYVCEDQSHQSSFETK